MGLCPGCPRLSAGKGSTAQALLAGGRDPELTCVSSQTLGALSGIRRRPGRKQGPFPENTERSKTCASRAAALPARGLKEGRSGREWGESPGDAPAGEHSCWKRPDLRAERQLLFARYFTRGVPASRDKPVGMFPHLDCSPSPWAQHRVLARHRGGHGAQPVTLSRHPEYASLSLHTPWLWHRRGD